MHVKTKIATLMNDIGLLHNKLADKHIALSGIMGQGIDEVVDPKLDTNVPVTEIQPVIATPVVNPVVVSVVEPVVATNVPLPTTVVNTVVVPTVLNAQSVSDEIPNVPTAVIVPVTPIVTPVAVAVPLIPSLITTEQQGSPESPELDDEGYYWDERIHASTKKKVKSKMVKGGEMWRIKQKCDPLLTEQVRAEQKAEGFGISGVSAPANIAVAPVAVAAPVAVVAPAVDAIDYDAIKSEGVKTITTLVTDFAVEYDDILEFLRETFKIKDFDDLKVEQYQPLADAMTKLFDEYNAIHNITLEIRKWGGDTHAASIDVGFATIFGNANTDTLGGVHYSQLSTVSEAMNQYRQSWIDAGLGA